MCYLLFFLPDHLLWQFWKKIYDLWQFSINADYFEMIYERFTIVHRAAEFGLWCELCKITCVSAHYHRLKEQWKWLYVSLYASGRAHTLKYNVFSVSLMNRHYVKGLFLDIINFPTDMCQSLAAVKHGKQCYWSNGGIFRCSVKVIDAALLHTVHATSVRLRTGNIKRNLS